MSLPLDNNNNNKHLKAVKFPGLVGWLSGLGAGSGTRRDGKGRNLASLPGFWPRFGAIHWGEECRKFACLERAGQLMHLLLDVLGLWHWSSQVDTSKVSSGKILTWCILPDTSGKISLESVYNEKSYKLQTNSWLIAWLKVGRGNGVHVEVEKWSERLTEWEEWLVSEARE